MVVQDRDNEETKERQLPLHTCTHALTSPFHLLASCLLFPNTIPFLWKTSSSSSDLHG